MDCPEFKPARDMSFPEKVSGPLALKLPPVLDTSPGADKLTAPPSEVDRERMPNANLVFVAVPSLTAAIEMFPPPVAESVTP